MLPHHPGFLHHQRDPPPAVHASPPPPGDASYFTIAQCNTTPYPGGAVVPPITVPSLPAFMSPNRLVISPTMPGHSPSLLTPPSPPDGPGGDDSPPLGANLQATITTNFAIAGLVATPITTHVQEDFLAHAGTLNHAVASPSPPTNPAFAAILLALGVINNHLDGMRNHMDGMPSTVATALRAKFVPCLDDLDDRIKMMEAFGPRLNDLDARATALRANFVPRLDDLDNRITTTDAFGPRLNGLDARATKTNALLMVKIADYDSHFGHITRTAIPGVQTDLMTLAACVTALEGHPCTITQPGITRPPPAAVPPAPSNPAPNLPAGVPPPHGNKSPVSPTIVGNVNPSDDGLGAPARSRIA